MQENTQSEEAYLVNLKKKKLFEKDKVSKMDREKGKKSHF